MVLLLIGPVEGGKTCHGSGWLGQIGGERRCDRVWTVAFPGEYAAPEPD